MNFVHYNAGRNQRSWLSPASSLAAGSEEIKQAAHQANAELAAICYETNFAEERSQCGV